MGDINPLQKTWRENRSAIYVILIVVFVVLLAAVIVVVKLRTFSDDNICNSIECVATSSFLLKLVDPTADPCDNFYKFTCGNYMGNTLIQDLQSTIDRSFKYIITNPFEDEGSRSVRMQKKYYQACMNLTAIEEDQNQTLKKLLKTVTDWPVLMGEKWNESNFEWSKILDKCRDAGLYYDWLIELYNEENKLYIGPPDNVNQIEDGLTDSYVDLIANVVKILGAPGNITDISEKMRKVVNFETELSKIINQSKVNETDTEYTIYDILDNKFPSIPWSSLLRHGELPLKIVFRADGYVPKLLQLLSKTNKRVQADYILWKLIESLSQFLTQDLRRHFEIYAELQSKNYKYQKNREDYCFRITTAIFAWVAEAEYVRKYASERESVRDMVNQIKMVLHDHLEKAVWMDQSDKDRAYNKLRNLSVIIGGPDEMYDENGFDKLLGVDQIDLTGLNNPIEIILNVDKSRDFFILDYEKRKPIDIQRARFYQHVINLEFIKYLPDENLMFLPAAALDGVFFSNGRPNFLSYGAIGSVIGHEMAHGFGIMGSSIYGDEMWSNNTKEKFWVVAECLLEGCNGIGIEDNITMNCERTFEENFADYAGITLSYEAYINLQQEEYKGSSLPALPYTSRQLFWIIYASILCNNRHSDVTENLNHMLDYQRIVGSFRQTEYFAKDFNCPVGSNMNPAKKCKIL